MTSVQIKNEIQKALDQVPETVLQDILDFVKELQTQTPEQIKLTNNLKKILLEDKSLLQRLAQ
jgi:mRNA-degrading endonuclease RelE of RelBE toxin-antitoxin system